MTTIVKSYRVKSSINAKKINLEGLDKNNYLYITLFYGYTSPGIPYGQIIEKIKHDLSILQDSFPMITGHIEYNYEANEAEHVFDGNGVVIIEAENNTIGMNDLAILSDNYDMMAAQVISSHFNTDIKMLQAKFNVQHFPFIVQVTKLKDNSIILTTTNSHMLMDGSTYEMLQKAWKAISKGLEAVQPDDKKIDYKSFDIQSEKPKGWIEIPRKFLLQGPSEDPHPTPSCRFHFSKEKLNQLKEVLNKQIKEQVDESKYVTTDEIISSLLWRSVVRYRKLDGDQPSSFVRPTNFRRLLKPMLSDFSVGNLAIMYGTTLSVDRVLSWDILEIIKEIQLQKDLYNKDKVLQNMKYFTELPFDKCLVMDFVGLGKNDIFINSYSKFDSLSSFDIGFGNNEFVCLPPVLSGAIVVFPTCYNQTEGFIAHTYLPKDLLQGLKTDTELLKFII